MEEQNEVLGQEQVLRESEEQAEGVVPARDEYGRLIFKWVARICLMMENRYDRVDIENLKREQTPPRLSNAGSFFHTVMYDAGAERPYWQKEDEFRHRWYVVVRGLAECYANYNYQKPGGVVLYRAGWTEGLLRDLIESRGDELAMLYLKSMRAIGKGKAKGNLTEIARLVLYQEEVQYKGISIEDSVRSRLAKGYAQAEAQDR